MMNLPLKPYAIGMETSAVGNHEFDKGKEELLRKQNGGCHPTAGVWVKIPLMVLILTT